uniref:Uncharacterized protein n=1 Tax=Rhizophora mucronata TaxID=61149 RepID=A0A2P2LK18_RHIMU
MLIYRLLIRARLVNIIRFTATTCTSCSIFTAAPTWHVSNWMWPATRTPTSIYMTSSSKVIHPMLSDLA